MKYELIIDEKEEESIVIRAHSRSEMIIQIENIINGTKNNKLLGYCDGEIVPLSLSDVYVFYTSNGKVMASLEDEIYELKERLYVVESVVDNSFVKINQGCIININSILKFDASITGCIKVILKNGFSDYISRRELKNVKRRLGL